MKEFLYIFLVALALNVISNGNPMYSIERTNSTLTNAIYKIVEDCSTFGSCTNCVSSAISCNWCLRSHRCVAHPDDKCRNDIVVAGTNRLAPYRNGPIFCPTINADSDGNLIFVKFGERKSISIKVNVIAQFIAENPLICQFDVGNRLWNTNGRLLGDTVYYDDTNFDYTLNGTNVNVNVKILWDGWKALDNPDNVHILIFQCDHFSERCDSCFNLPEKYGCGWCAFENKCSLRKNCREYPEHPFAWFTIATGLCSNAKISTVTPHHVQKTAPKMVELIMDGLPSVKNDLVCTFATVNNTIFFTNATRTQNGVRCQSLNASINPAFPLGKHHFESTLAVQTRNGFTLASTPFTFYDCAAYRTCTECVSSQYPCDWCIDGHRCTHDTNEHCRNDILVTGVNQIGPSYRSGPKFCPKIKSSSDDNQILVPFGAKKMIPVKIENIFQLIVQTEFECEVSIEGRVIRVHGSRDGNTIFCYEILFSYQSHLPNITASIAVIWGGNKTLDNPNNVHALIYKCSGMAVDSDSCSTLSEKYNCFWCKSSMDCKEKHDCRESLWDEVE